jgi:hypothetical protein
MRKVEKRQHNENQLSDKKQELLDINMDSPETLATWTVQRHWQHLTHKTKDEDKQNNKTQTQHNNEN